MARLAVASAAVAVGVVAGCAHGARGGPAPAREVRDSAAAGITTGPIPVEVDNRSSYDVIIYAVQGSLRRRIGSVPGLSRTRVTVPTTFTTDLGGFSVAAVRLAGRETYVSDLVSPRLVTRLRLLIQPRIVESALSVE